MATFERMTARRHYGHEDMQLLDKHIDYDQSRLPSQRAVVFIHKEPYTFKNLTLAREFVRDHILTDRQREKLASLEIGYITDVNGSDTRKVTKKRAPAMKAYNIDPAKKVIITMTVNGKRVKVDCTSTKQAIEILKNL